MVADFGIALALSAAAGGRMTETGLSLGTPHYMSPEQATAEKEITARSDVYSLGSVLYEMLAGQPPHLGGSAQQIIMKIVTEDATPVTQHRKSVPLNVAAAVAKALEKLPADRFESARALAEALQNPGFTAGGTVAMRAAATGGRPTRVNYVLAGVAAAALAVAAWSWTRPGAPPAMQDSWRVELAIPDSLGTSDTPWPALSPDGTTLAVILGDDQVWLFRADGTPAAPVAGTQGAYSVSIAPDGNRLAVFRGGRLEVVSLAGGTPTRVTDSIQVVDPATWIDDNTLVFTMIRGLVKIPGSGGPVTDLTSAPDGMFHIHPAALPGGRGVVFSVQPADLLDASQSRIAVVGPKGGSVTDLMPGLWAAYGEPDHLIVAQANGNIVAVPFDLESFRITGEATPIVTGLPISGFISEAGHFGVSATGRLVYLTGKQFNRTDLVRVRRNGTREAIDTSRSGDFASVAVSPDGRWAAASVFTAKADELRLRDLATGAQIRISEPGLWLRRPAFLPDSRTLLFTGVSRNRIGLFRATVDGSTGPEQLFSTPGGYPFGPSLSPDGATIYYTLSRPAGAQLAVHTPADSGGPGRVISSGQQDESSVAASPDGRWLAYLSDESGRTELAVRPVELSRPERWQVPRPAEAGAGSPANPRWSRDGRELVYRSGTLIVSAGIAPGPSFAVTGHRVFFPAADYGESFDLFPNGDLLMIRQRPPSERPMHLIMIDRWNAGLEPR